MSGHRAVASEQGMTHDTTEGPATAREGAGLTWAEYRERLARALEGGEGGPARGEALDGARQDRDAVEVPSQGSAG